MRTATDTTAQPQEKLQPEQNLVGNDVTTSIDEGLKLDPPKLVAKAIGVNTATLARWRAKGRGPAFVQLSSQNVAYQRSTWHAWLRSRTFRTTAEARVSLQAVADLHRVRFTAKAKRRQEPQSVADTHT
jgi:hypothetical protein